MKTTPRYEVNKHISRITARNAYSSSQASLALLDRDQIDTLVSTYALSPSSYGEHHLLPVFTSFACSGYRYGSDSYRNQGQEKDDEVKGKGNSVNYTFRMHDPRIGRFFAVDPLAYKFPYYSPYQFSSNSPILTIELEGLESAVQINYVEGEVIIYRGADGRMTVTSAELKAMPLSPTGSKYYRRTEQNHNFIDIRSGGSWDIQCVDCNFDGGEVTVRLMLPQNAKITTYTTIEELLAVQNLNNNGITPNPIPDEPIAGNSSPIVEPVIPKKSIPSLLNNNQRSEISKTLNAGSSLMKKSTSGPTSLEYEAAPPSMRESIGYILKSYKKYDLSNEKISVNMVVNRKTRNLLFYTGVGEKWMKGIVNELVKSGFKAGNITTKVKYADGDTGTAISFQIQQ